MSPTDIKDIQPLSEKVRARTEEALLLKIIEPDFLWQYARSLSEENIEKLLDIIIVHNAFHEE